MMTFVAFVFGVLVYSTVRVVIGCLYTVRPDQRAVVTSFRRRANATDAGTPESHSRTKKRFVTSILRFA